MAGILDSKKRVMDTIITQEGKRQLASGQFQIKYASFTDTYDFYEGDATDGCTDATKRIHIEASHADNDSIVIESDDSGNLVNFNSGAIVLDEAGEIKYDTGTMSDALKAWTTAAPTDPYAIFAEVKFNEDGNPIFSSLAEVVLDTTFGAFDSQNIIRTEVYDETDTDFNIEIISSDSGNATFDYRFTGDVNNIDGLPSFIDDPHMSKIDNFSFLPPINKNDGTANGAFENQFYTGTFEIATISGYELIGGSSDGDAVVDSVAIELNELLDVKSTINTRLSNKNNNDNIMIQMFEIDEIDKKITKLDLINFGIIPGSDSYWIFVGKVKEKIIDEDEDVREPVFIKMFSLEFKNDS